MFTPTIQDYFKAQKTLEENFGKKSVVLLQVGSFYEIYGVETESLKLGNVKEAGDALRMRITLKNGRDKPHGPKNVYMAGFPDYSLHNHVSKLLNNNFVVAVYDQNEDKKTRSLTEIFSPSTYINTNYSPSWLMCVNTEKYKKGIEVNLSLSITLLNIITGEVILTEIYSENWEDEFQRLINVYSPNEILMVNEMLDLNIVKIKLETNKSFDNITFQNKFFEQIYKNNSNLDIIEYLGIERYPSLITSLIYTLDYIHKQNSSILENIKKPVLLDNKSNLILNGDTIVQLHLNDLFNTINFCKTKMGEGILKNNLFQPFTDINILQTSYNNIEAIIDSEISLDLLLTQISDIPKLIKLISTRKITIKQTQIFCDSLIVINEILNDTKYLFDIPEKLIKKLGKIRDFINETFDFEQVVPFKKGIVPDIDLLQKNNEYCENVITKFAKDISGKCVYTKKDGWYITKYKSFDVKVVFENERYTLTESNFEKVQSAKGVKLTNNLIKNINQKIIENNLLIESLTKQKLNEIYTIFENSKSILKSSKIIGNIDFWNSAAICANKFGYSKPTVFTDTKSWFEVAKLRHPIIERIIKEEYIPNDFELGNSKKGALIYGSNTVGKSSFIRSVGLGIIMAQAGLFVACESFSFSPYNKLFSKITTTDDQFSGKSTFAVEMSEVRNMVLNSDPQTLVLSDELCCSTETHSACSIVAATLSILSQRESNFLFATHLHQLQYIPVIKNDNNLKIFHFDISIVNGKLVYSRTLKPDGSTKLYGLEIASTMGLGDTFLKVANGIRNDLVGDCIYSDKTSRYNKDVFMDSCNRCGSKKDLVTHHIRHQEEADSNGMIDKRFHKNSHWNLEVLCESCHKDEHK